MIRIGSFHYYFVCHYVGGCRWVQAHLGDGAGEYVIGIGIYGKSDALSHFYLAYVGLIHVSDYLHVVQVGYHIQVRNVHA